MANSVQVALINSAGQIVIKSGPVGVASNMHSPLQAVAIYVKYEDTPGNEVTIRYKGADTLSCEVTSDGETCIYERVLSGPGKGAKVHTHVAVGSPVTRTLVTGTEDVVASAETSWDVYEAGDGAAYEAALADADAAVGYP